MKKYYNKLKKHLFSDNFLKEVFYIDKEINGSSFFIAVILRLSLLSFLAYLIPNRVVLIPIIIYFSFNTLKWRIKAIYGGVGTGFKIFTVLWTISLTFNLMYLVFGQLYAVPFSLPYAMDFPFYAQSTKVIYTLAGIHAVSTVLFIISVIFLSLRDKHSGEKLFLDNQESYYSQRQYLNIYIKLFAFNIGFFLIFTLGLIVVNRDLDLSIPQESVAAAVLLFIWSLINYIAYFYNTSKRIKDFSLSGLWVIVLFLLTIISFVSNPVASIGSNLLVSKNWGSEGMVAWSQYIYPLISLVSQPLYSFVLISYFILLFVPGRSKNL